MRRHKLSVLQTRVSPPDNRIDYLVWKIGHDMGVTWSDKATVPLSRSPRSLVGLTQQTFCRWTPTDSSLHLSESAACPCWFTRIEGMFISRCTGTSGVWAELFTDE
jgi:hypothetical protein